ncbi:MAG: ComEC family competence protein [Bacteroidetes bacterium]|nr:ComEC family competence protein [Bacteroidota bacterium]
MQQWLAFPWVRDVLWLLAGLLLAYAFPGWEQEAMWLSLLAATLYVGALLLLKQNKPQTQLLWGMLAFSFLLFFGYWRMAETQQPLQIADLEAEHWWVRVDQEPSTTARSFRFRGKVYPVAEQREQGGAAAPAIEAVVYVSQALGPPKAGQLLLVRVRLQPVQGLLNPHEFDNKAYLASQHIYHQLFATHYVAARAGWQAFSFWQRVAIQSRGYLLAVAGRLLPDQQAAAVVKAMVLGQRSELDSSLRQAYADAGVMHVLAVSGLHVGMVFGLMYLLFPLVRRHWWQRILWLILVLAVLWGYAWLTGLAPSAQRAAAMFTIIAMGQALRRRGNVYNSIALSAFTLLVWNPLLLLQVGFQLSYLAVSGIVYLQPRIKSWLAPKQWWLNKLWELVSVTLAAQLATFPLGLYYFHQFPTYFFIGNLLAVPLAFLILYSTLLMLALHWLPWLGTALGWVVNQLAAGLNAWVQLTEQLPFSRLVATITATEMVLLYLSLIAVLLLFRQRSFAWGVAGFVLLLGFAGSGIVRMYGQRNQQSLTIYQIPGHSLLHFIQGQQEVLMPLGDTPDYHRLGYHVMPARLQAGFAPLEPGQALPRDFRMAAAARSAVTYMYWQGLCMAVIDGKQQPILLQADPLQVDVLLLRNSPKVGLEQLTAAFSFGQLVLDASNTLWYRQKMESEANLLHLPVHVTSAQGAYHLQL